MGILFVKYMVAMSFIDRNEKILRLSLRCQEIFFGDGASRSDEIHPLHCRSIMTASFPAVLIWQITGCGEARNLQAGARLSFLISTGRNAPPSKTLPARLAAPEFSRNPHAYPDSPAGRSRRLAMVLRASENNGLQLQWSSGA
jgi:hypothetical protein